MIEFDCPTCRKRLRLADEHGGRKVKCPKCATLLVVPMSVAELLSPSSPPHEPVDHGGDEGPLFPAAHKEEEEMIDMTAMVDIVFFLLIFFLVTSLHSLQASI